MLLVISTWWRCHTSALCKWRQAASQLQAKLRLLAHYWCWTNLREQGWGASSMCAIWWRRRASPLRNSRPCANSKLAMRLTLATPPESPHLQSCLRTTLRKLKVSRKVVSDHVRPFLEVVWHVVRSLGNTIFVSATALCFRCNLMTVTSAKANHIMNNVISAAGATVASPRP